MDWLAPMDTADDYARLRDENEQLRTALESSLDENASISEDRDRLLKRVTTLARELQSANRTCDPSPTPNSLGDEDIRKSETEEELRVAFEELQVLTEELEVANTSLEETNAQLEQRVDERTRALAQANASLRQSESAFRVLIEGIPQLAWRSRNEGRWTWSSPQWQSYTGQTYDESLADGWLDAIHPDDRAGVAEAWMAAEAKRALEFEARIYHAREDRYRHFHTRAVVVLTDEGVVAEWLGTSTDIDDLIQLQHRQGILIDELQHRTRNLMAVVQAVTLRTIKGSKTLEEFRQCIDDRMQALARVQGLLSRRGLGKVSFEELLYAELSSQMKLDDDGNAAQVSTVGPRGVPLRSSIVQTLALAIHELLTNAVKYGALAIPTAHLDVSWELLAKDEAERRLLITWKESGVPMAEAGSEPPRGGYGRELIERALPYQLGAKTGYRFAEDGVHCTIEMMVPSAVNTGANS
ncbi:HWE histidine kinase domain-containing protein [Sphingomonas sp. PB2P19]|uniref:sensor histidine kinase n=1 Tax=Sphingomonas rhamnosi TaxID=3096156 RepID=UPI002FC954E5